MAGRAKEACALTGVMLLALQALSRQRAVWRHHTDAINRDDGAPGCSATSSECTQSLCCSNSAARCDRRPDFHHAQCRSEKAPCVPWDERATALNGSTLWLCPGWEACAAAWSECTLSRCSGAVRGSWPAAAATRRYRSPPARQGLLS